MAMNYKSFCRQVGANIKQVRERQSLSVDAIAKATGKTTAIINSWESGKSVPSLAQLLQLAGVLDVSVAELVDNDDAVEPEADPTLPAEEAVLTEQEREILNRFRGLRNDRKEIVIGLLNSFERIDSCD